ncbi:MAG: UvrB/UvrC motif-containing protein [Candidatus Brocadiae bacterium]|nr:UvrB/UvrC motif-containing protein [Candidatus Brocadiia bacterium]
MICEKCGKNDANIFYSEVKGKENHKHCLCTSCANEIIPVIEKPNMGDSLQKMLADFLGIIFSEIAATEKQGDGVCSFCNMTFEDFQKNPRLGCARDYDVFQSTIEGMLASLHSSTRHVGKKPQAFLKRKDNFVKLQEFQEQLKKAISEERYEDAAAIRDQIAKLERQGHGIL